MRSVHGYLLMVAVTAAGLGAACSKTKTTQASAAGPQGATYTPPAAPAADPQCQKTPKVAPSTGTATSAATGTSATLALDSAATAPAVQQSASWSEVKALIQASCLGSCHTHDSLLTFDNAKAVAAQMVEDTDLDTTDPNFMPQGAPRLALADREKLVLWLAAGTPDDAAQTPPSTAPVGIGTGTATDVGTVDGKSRFNIGTQDAGPPKDGCS